MIDQQLLKQVRSLVEEVGRYQLNHFRSLPPGGGEEKSAREFVSEVDRHSEMLLIDGLGKLLPEAGFYGEETGISGSDKLRWVIDPLDGTSNFLSGLDQFCISVALEADGHSKLGVILRPASNECFTALYGQGFYRNGQRCQQAIDLPLQHALIGTGFPFRSKDLSADFFSCAEKVLYASRGLRRFGAAALDLSYVAAGFLQGFWESDLEPYDVAAALLFLHESGCVVSNRIGQEYSPYRDRLLICGPPRIHGELLALVAKYYQAN